MLGSEFYLGTVLIWGAILSKDQFPVTFSPRDTDISYLSSFSGFVVKEIKQFDEMSVSK